MTIFSDLSYIFEDTLNSIFDIEINHVVFQNFVIYFGIICLANGSSYSTKPPSPLMSTSSLLKIRFTSDGSISESGVLMSYILGKYS